MAGRWHGADRYVGLHYDMHAGAHTRLDSSFDAAAIGALLDASGADFAQCDCKGHPGFTSWPSRVAEASVPPRLGGDLLRRWRDATAQRGMPLHAHYSGIYEKAITRRHPDWAIVAAADGVPMDPNGQNAGAPSEAVICPRSPYLDRLMIPQMREVIDRYGLDGFWIDGDLWAAAPCHCRRCRAAFRAETGIRARPPSRPGQPHWPQWIAFTLRSFESYVCRYVAAIHEHAPQVLVASNWLQTVRHPGEPVVPTDWISGDNTWVFGLDDCRIESRFISSRGKPWDIMLWSFYKMHAMHDRREPWCPKPLAMLQQEAAVVASWGGRVQIYEGGGGAPGGRMVPWRVERLRAVTDFLHQRQAWCLGSSPAEQVAVLHSEHHARRHLGANLMWGCDIAHVRGATLALLEQHIGTEVLDEWALLPRLADFRLVVVPEQADLSRQAVTALRDWVAAGGRLLISGAAAWRAWGADFLGCGPGRLLRDRRRHLPLDDGTTVPAHGDWRLLRAQATAQAPLGALHRTPLPGEFQEAGDALVLHRVGRGRVAYVPGPLGRQFDRHHFIGLRRFLAAAVQALAPRLDRQIDGPTAVDVSWRRRDGHLLCHLVNRLSGVANRPNDGAVDEIPPVGPITVRLRCRREPGRVRLLFESARLRRRWLPGRGRSGTLEIRVPRLHLHAAVSIEGG